MKNSSIYRLCYQNMLTYPINTPKPPKNPLKTPCILMINLIPGGFFEHAEDSLMPENPGFFRTPFKAPSPGGGGVSIK